VFRRFGVSAETEGYWLGTMIIPALIAYAIAGARKRRNWLACSGWFLGLTIVLNGVTGRQLHTLGSMSKPSLMRQLTGVNPLDSDLMGKDREAVVLSRAVFEDIRQFRKSQEPDRAQVQAVYPELYTAKSFSTQQSVNRVLSAMRTSRDLEDALYEKLKSVPEMVRSLALQSSLSASDREEFVTKFLDGYRNSKSNAATFMMVEADRNWIAASISLYEFAKEHFSEISVQAGKVRIADEVVLNEFNDRFHSALKLRDVAITAENAFDTTRATEASRQGYSMEDVGEKGTASPESQRAKP
jgi:hypothetical protein